MKIIREGKLPTYVFRAHCSVCGCIAEAAESELKELGDCDKIIDMWYGCFPIIQCPTRGCRGRFVFEESRAVK